MYNNVNEILIHTYEIACVKECIYIYIYMCVC